MKTRPQGKMPREEAALLKGFCTPALRPTTSEPQTGNGLPGAPVIASMSGRAICNQGGTVEYFLYPTPDLSGGGYFFTFLPN